VLIRGVADYQLGEDANAPSVRLLDQAAKVVHRSIVRMDAVVVGDVITIVAQRRGVHRQKPQTGDAEALDVRKLFDQPWDVADSIRVRIVERADVHLVDDRLLVPEGILVDHSRFSPSSKSRGCLRGA